VNATLVENNTTLLIEDTMEFPGFITLKWIAEGNAFTNENQILFTVGGFQNQMQ
jgi:hypothetical protein